MKNKYPLMIMMMIIMMTIITYLSLKVTKPSKSAQRVGETKNQLKSIKCCFLIRRETEMGAAIRIYSYRLAETLTFKRVSGRDYTTLELFRKRHI